MKKIVVLKVELYNNVTRGMVMKTVAEIPGVGPIVMEKVEDNLSVTGDMDPEVIVSKLRKICHATIISVAPAIDEPGHFEKKKKQKMSPDFSTSQLLKADDLDSSSSSLPGYEVFLSFSSLDNCHAFANSLYTALSGVGVHIFRDIENSPEGEEIDNKLVQSIRQSKILIPIFSKSYVSSKRCLGELTQMVECKRSMGQLILPIFYDVEPSDVKHPSGSYEEALHVHAKCFNERTVKEWKEALREVGQLKGWDLNEELNWQGVENFIKENIVPTVLLELKKNYMVVTNYLVGMDYHVNQMMRLLEVDSNEVRIVGIQGVSGIGKTTTAKFIYQMLLEYFECCSFLTDVREVVQQHKGGVSLQKQLLSDILKRCPDIADVDTGIDVIKNIVIKKKVLIVLDDLDESCHFARLLGKREWFGSGSRIIITTKDIHVLDDLKVDATYELPLMDYEQSVQLFSMHAFRRKFPPIDYDSISKEVASTLAGIPLALEVVGSFLSSMEKAVWEDTVKKLDKISHDEVEKKLRVIYEALNYAQQQIFLDIACLFIGMDKAAVFYMWDDCGYHPKKELNALCLMSLVKVGDVNELRMHHQLRALGRKIVNEEKIRGNRSRLWNHEDALNMFEGRRGTKKVEAVSLHFELGPEKKPRFTSKEFTKLVNLRYLRVDGTDLVGDFEHLLPQLRWLDWRSCSSNFKPTNFHLKNLVILDLSDSGITEDWRGWNQIKMATKLKVLKLANCALRRTPDFSSYVALEILILRCCKSLVEVDRSIGNMTNLKVLDISYSDIRNLPDEIWMLEKLEVLDFTHCDYLKGHIPSNMGSLTSLRLLSFYDTKIESLPTSIWELSCLQTLKLGGCTELQSQPQLPSSLRSLDVACIPNEANLVNLQELHFVGRCENVEIPRDIGKFSKLEKLTLDSTSIRSLPKELSALSHLKVLDVQFCHDLQSILELPSNLVVLSLAFCYSLERLPNLSNLKILSKLSLRSCIKLIEVQGLGNLESLIRLDIYACDMLANLDLLEQTSLEMRECKDLEEMPNLSNLEIVSITYCPELKTIPGLDKLESLKYLVLHGCLSLREIEALEALKSSHLSRRRRSLHSVKGESRGVVNLLQNNLEGWCLQALEPLLRRVVNEEVEHRLRHGAPYLTRSLSLRTQELERSSLQLTFCERLLLPIFTGSKIVDTQNNPLQICLVDTIGNHQMFHKSVSYPIKVEIVVLDGDFPLGGCDTWASQEFDNHIVRERSGRRPLLTGDLQTTISDTFARIGDIEFTDNSSWVRSRKFRIGARVFRGCMQGVRIREAITESFVVKDHRGELYRKHHPLMLEDDVWRLEKIGRYGAFHKKLACAGINTVQEFLKLFVVDSAKLRNILGVGMSEKMWEAMVKHAKTCIMGNKMYISSGSNYTIILNPICQVVKAVINGQTYHNDDRTSTNRAYIENLVKDAYINWKSLQEVDGILNETPLLTQGAFVGQHPSNHQTLVRSNQQHTVITDESTEMASTPSNVRTECNDLDDKFDIPQHSD